MERNVTTLSGKRSCHASPEERTVWRFTGRVTSSLVESVDLTEHERRRRLVVGEELRMRMVFCIDDFADPIKPEWPFDALFFHVFLSERWGPKKNSICWEFWRYNWMVRAFPSWVKITVYGYGHLPVPLVRLFQATLAMGSFFLFSRPSD